MDYKGVRNAREKGQNEFLCESQIVSVLSFFLKVDITEKRKL